jgi:hypothetical protein
MYTMVVGRPPFETPEVENTYKRIKEIDYTFPTDDQRIKQKLPPLTQEF